MRLQTARGPVELTYCTNVHRGESLSEVFANLRGPVSEVKARVCPSGAFGVGLWLSAAAARALETETALCELRELLDAQAMYVPTLNGFPFGNFHGSRVKERVYEPDWRSPARREHSGRLARILAALVPDGAEASISTVPGAYKPAMRGPDDAQLIAGELIEHAAELARLEEQTGKRITLALEPEPCCMLETIAETVAFFEQHLQSERALARLAERAGSSRSKAGTLLRRHLGVCLDACHAAVEYEDPVSAVAALRRAEIPIAKTQLSAGLRIPSADAAAREALRAFAEEVYLHQVVARGANQETLTRYTDLPGALATPITEPAPEWRVHFHVPVFAAHAGRFETTQDFLRALLAEHLREPLCMQLEVETYTFEVLPDSLRPSSLSDGLAKELRFCMAELSALA